MKIDPNLAALAEHIAKQSDFSPPHLYWVSIYRTHRCYGGPEEGGWWYDRREFAGGKPFHSRDEAEAWLERARVEVEHINRQEAPERWRAMANLPDPEREPLPDYPGGEGYIPRDWSDGGELEIVIEEVRGQSDNMNEATPHYE